MKTFNTVLKKLIPILALSLSSQAYGFEDKIDNFTVGIEYSNYNYKETVNGKTFMNLKGPLYGVNLSYLYNEDDYFVDINGRLLFGKTKYTGGRPDPATFIYSPCNFKGVGNKIFESQISPGIKADIFNLYVGVGYRIKTDNSQEYGYAHRKSQYLYIPIGVKILSKEYENDYALSIAPYIEYDFLVKGAQSAGLIRLNQNKGYGAKAGVVCKIDQFEITPYFNFWNIKDSNKYIDANSGTWWMEPANKTTEIGIKVSFRF